ncbi:hypothetical protein [Agromyces sp. Marseille-P2726]|uniref:hypothetical protein n=1 Tax=Agromyces sp. Marseille-P2726 TaxID=2709132 RepID=UPI0015703550|nr:hypothetical protein [Agromyces sp. Marseille-P2726]
MSRSRRASARERPHAAVIVVTFAVAASLLTACTNPGAEFDRAVEQGSTAVETARLAVALERDGRTFASTTTTALEDARRELVDAASAVAETDAESPSDAALRADLLDALALGVTAVNEALDAMAGIGTLDAVEPALDEAEEALDALGAPGGTR